MSILLGAVVLLACGMATYSIRPTILGDVQHLIEEQDFNSNGDNNGKQFGGGNLPTPNRVLHILDRVSMGIPDISRGENLHGRTQDIP